MSFADSLANVAVWEVWCVLTFAMAAEEETDTW